MKRDILVALLGSDLTLAGLHLGARLPGSGTTTSGRAKVRGEKAFVLAVNLKFRTEADAANLIKRWRFVADHCHRNEPWLYSYEIAQSDKAPLEYMMIERYHTKEEYLTLHRHSDAFKAFRPEMKALQDSGAVVVSGSSYNELGVGFV